ncbi:hypothetical protein [Zeimonas arvi]|uniref:Uncharacterized protein n=1 Tax=Zeimonas arvi TaxID=2498847 RepID=A0A5C8NRR9_9BURK|nr:hypothetical protein [Zeimonas arvi]TXL63515.1 hypothetical protein FHP08_16880 [Zeimonas arvi]
MNGPALPARRERIAGVAGAEAIAETDPIARPRTIAGTAAIACLPLLLLWPALRHAIESRMLLHMLVEFPALLASGWAVRRMCPASGPMRALSLAWRQLDWRGWTGATLLSAVTAVWMIPTLLDLALLTPAVAAAKHGAWWLAGWAIADSWGRLDPELRLWMLGNLAWMTGTAGLLYLDAPQRLCVNYLQDDQRLTGIALIALALLLGALGLREAMRPPASP